MNTKSFRSDIFLGPTSFLLGLRWKSTFIRAMLADAAHEACSTYNTKILSWCIQFSSIRIGTQPL